MTHEAGPNSTGPRVLIALALALSAVALGISVNQRRANARAATTAQQARSPVLVADPADDADTPRCAACEANKHTFRVEPMFSDHVNAVRRELFDLMSTDGQLTNAQVERLASLIEPALIPGASQDDRLIALVAFRALGDGRVWNRIEDSARDTVMPVLETALWNDHPAIRLAALRCGLASGALGRMDQDYHALIGEFDPEKTTSPESRLVRAWASIR